MSGSRGHVQPTTRARPAALQFDATTSGAGFTGTGVDDGPRSCIGCFDQHRAYGWGMNATFSVDPTGRQTLAGDFNGGVGFCPRACGRKTTRPCDESAHLYCFEQ